MRKFLITSNLRFTGQIEIVYNQEQLHSISFENAGIDADTERSFLANASKAVLFSFFLEVFNSSHLTIVESSMRIDFEQWWREYGKKINKKRCIPLYKKLSDSDTVLALLGIKPYDKYLASLPYKRPKADPEKYLKDRYWENEWK